MDLREELKPRTKQRVIDLVQAAGVGVSGWSKFSKPTKCSPASNPRYCYDWSFVEPGKVVVLNLWYDNLQLTRKTASVRTNMRLDWKQLIESGAHATRIARAKKMDEAITKAYKNRLTVRIIINDGTMRERYDPTSEASRVSHRLLDPVPWAITSLNLKTGACTITRGGKVIRPVDQFSITPGEGHDPERVDRRGKAFKRDSAVRLAVLRRANNQCEFCGEEGFTTTNGESFLETHHIVPLSMGGRDAVSNVAAICPNHHREAHFGVQAPIINDALLERAKPGRRKR